MVAGGAPDRLLSEKDLKPGKVEFESMDAARDAIKGFCWSKSYPFYVRQSDPNRFVVECPSTMKKKVKKIMMGDGEGEGHVAGQTNEEVASQTKEEVAGQTNEEEVAGQTNEEQVAGQEVAGQQTRKQRGGRRSDERGDERGGCCRSDERGRCWPDECK